MLVALSAYFGKYGSEVGFLKYYVCGCSRRAGASTSAFDVALLALVAETRGPTLDLLDLEPIGGLLLTQGRPLVSFET